MWSWKKNGACFVTLGQIKFLWNELLQTRLTPQCCIITRHSHIMKSVKFLFFISILPKTQEVIWLQRILSSGSHNRYKLITTTQCGYLKIYVFPKYYMTVRRKLFLVDSENTFTEEIAFQLVLVNLKQKETRR